MGNRFNPADRTTLHLQIDFRVTVRGGRAGVSEILADRRQIHSGLQERDGRAVPHAMRMKPLLAEIGSTLAGTVKTPGEDVTNTESGQRFATVIQKQACF